MYADNTLTPKEAIRLCALGTLAGISMAYGELAVAIRHFLSRLIGPTPEIMGHSLELLKLEGLIEPVAGDGDRAILHVTDAGRAELRALLTAGLRPANTELNSLVIALKVRFLHVLPAADRRRQADLLLDVTEQEIARLDDLRQHHLAEGGYLSEWLGTEIVALEGRLSWLASLRQRLEVEQAA